MAPATEINHLCTEFCRFILWLGHETISLKCDQEPSTLSLLEAVRKTCRCLGVKTIVETVAPGSHASNGAAEVTVKLLRRQANLLIQQLERVWKPRRYNWMSTPFVFMVTSSCGMVA